MKFLISLLAVAVSAPAMAKIDVNPAVNEAVCLQRVYSKAELAQSPAQKLSEVTIKVYTTADTVEGTTYVNGVAQVIGRNVANKKLYGNTAWNFNNQQDASGNVTFQIECDGGSFSLNQRSKTVGGELQEWINFAVTKDYYFPLFKGVLEPDTDKLDQPGYELQLDGNDGDNNVWRLEEVPLRKCEEKLKQITKFDGGC